MQYMTHTKHGKMPVYTPTDIEVNKKHGWVLEVVKPKEMPVVDDARENFEHDMLVARYIGKFNKKPHPRMKDKTIQAKLDE